MQFSNFITVGFDVPIICFTMLNWQYHLGIRTPLLDQCIFILREVFTNRATLCPEGAENIPLGSQVSDLCF